MMSARPPQPLGCRRAALLARGQWAGALGARAPRRFICRFAAKKLIVRRQCGERKNPKEKSTGLEKMPASQARPGEGNRTQAGLGKGEGSQQCHGSLCLPPFYGERKKGPRRLKYPLKVTQLGSSKAPQSPSEAMRGCPKGGPFTGSMSALRRCGWGWMSFSVQINK
jgi:hypothetical protein